MSSADKGTPPHLAEIVRRLVAAYQPQAIYLFGSHAREEAGPDSDFDLMVIVADDVPTSDRDTRKAHDALWGLPTAVDTLISTQSQFEQRLSVPASLPATVCREGRLLYAA